MRGSQPAPLPKKQPQVLPPQVLPLEKQPHVYTETQRELFHRRVKALSLSALNSPIISKSTRNGVFEIAVPNESPEELYRAAGCE